MWWWNSKPKHFPLTQGPYVPGCMDVMSGFTEEATFARIYYPTSLHAKDNTPSKWYKWIPHDKYVEGFANLISWNASLIKMACWALGGLPLVPCVWEGTPLLNKKLPVIVFSHGFGGTRFISATIAAELAAYGFLIACIEHRESSASATYYYATPADRDSDKKTWIPHQRLQFGPNHYEIRNQQLQKRVSEVRKLIDLMECMNKGNAENILTSSLDIQLFKDKLDMSKLSLMGHSFGGAASLLTMVKDERPQCAVILDGWMFPLKDEGVTIEKPLLFINTQSFHIESNLKAMDRIIDQNKDNREVYTLRYTTHETHTDGPHYTGYWLDWFKKKLDPVEGTTISNFLVLRFYHKMLGFPESLDDIGTYLEEKDPVIMPGTHLFVNGKPVALSEHQTTNQNMAKY